MRRADITIPITSVAYGELSADDRLLVDSARAAATSAYAPYSHFCVGAAIRLSDGAIINGSNQENAAFPSGTCAERTAAFYAHASHPNATFTAIAVAAIDTDGKETSRPIAPCGACRQALLEYETLAGRPVKVLLYGSDEIFILPSLRSMLPVAFTDF